MCHPYSWDICLHAYGSSYFSRIASNYDDMGAEDHGRSKPWQNMSATLIAVFVARSRSCPRSTGRTNPKIRPRIPTIGTIAIFMFGLNPTISKPW
jgi:hypothetical protein